MNRYNLNEAHSVGEALTILIQHKGWTGRALAGILQLDETNINRILQNKKPITPQLALKLAELFDYPALDFMILQVKYDLALAQLKETPDPMLKQRAELFGQLPIADMINRAWLDVENKKDYAKVESELLKLFSVQNISEITQDIAHSAKKANALSHATLTQLAWVNHVKRIAQEMLVAVPYTHEKGLQAIEKLKKLLFSEHEVRHVPRILQEHGIRFVIVEALKGSKIDGVCLWLDDNQPVIGMSLRFDRIDNFWFVLRHELEHVLQGHGKNIPKIDDDLSFDVIDEEEKIANEAAAYFAISKQKWESFIARKYPFFSEQDLIGLSNTTQVHAGIIAGKLQHKMNRYNIFRKYLVSIRSLIIPYAIVDGWGSVYPLEP